MKKSEITAVLAELVQLRQAIQSLEQAYENRKRYPHSAETEAVRWRAVCLSRALRALTGGDEI